MDLPPALRRPEARALLDHQHGLVSAEQLRELGLDPRFARQRVAAGRWQRPHRGVYATFSGLLGRTAQIWAAILLAGPGAAASHATAAELQGLSGRIDDRVHVTAPVSRRVRNVPNSVVVHYAHRLPLTRHPAQSPPRTRIEATVLDLVDTATSARAVESFVTMAVQKRLTNVSRLGAALMARKKIKWRHLIEGLLLDISEGAQSPLEREHLHAVERAHGLPSARRQRRHTGRRVIWTDVDYDEFGVRVELDGRLGHEGDGRFRDRRRDNAGVVAGAATLRYGHAEVFGSPCEVAAEQASVLKARGWAGAPRPCRAGCPAPTGSR